MYNLFGAISSTTRRKCHTLAKQLNI